MADDSRERWHLDKRVQISHIVTTVVVAVGAVLYIGDIKRDVEVLKAQYQSQRDRDSQQDRAFADSVQLLREDLKAVNAKLDRLIESRSK